VTDVRRVEDHRPVVFPDGRQFILLGKTTGKWCGLDGVHNSYVIVERVEYASTLGEQFLQQRAK
jgi:hypothetical protein